MVELVVPLHKGVEPEDVNPYERLPVPWEKVVRHSSGRWSGSHVTSVEAAARLDVSDHRGRNGGGCCSCSCIHLTMVWERIHALDC